MAEITVTTKEKRAVRFLRAECGVRYWEDGTVNGEEDEDGSRIPCRVDDAWLPTIDLETGLIADWPSGTTADLHYKVCDDGSYMLLDEGGNVVTSISGYVPKIMCPGGDGFGDYVIMQIDGDGRIKNWKLDLTAFERSGTDKEDG